jgi:hypothetical protein
VAQAVPGGGGGSVSNNGLRIVYSGGLVYAPGSPNNTDLQVVFGSEPQGAVNMESRPLPARCDLTDFGHDGWFCT